MTATTRRCALFASHPGPCAVWEHLPDAAEPVRGVRCRRRLERPPQHWQIPVLRADMRREEARRDIVLKARHAAAQFGYRGRVRFVKLAVDGADNLYALRVEAVR
jgi:hypothetical protein